MMQCCWFSELQLDRYKYAVQVVLGEQRGEGVRYKLLYTNVEVATRYTFSCYNVVQNGMQMFLGFRLRQLCTGYIHECKLHQFARN